MLLIPLDNEYSQLPRLNQTRGIALVYPPPLPAHYSMSATFQLEQWTTCWKNSHIGFEIYLIPKK